MKFEVPIYPVCSGEVKESLRSVYLHKLGLTIDYCCNEAETQMYREITVEKQENTCEDEGKKACISTASGWLLFEEGKDQIRTVEEACLKVSKKLNFLFRIYQGVEQS